jgi:hypothetical protein
MTKMATNESRHRPTSLLEERGSFLALQRRQTRFVGEASQIVFRAMGVLARQQADALQAMFSELGDTPRPVPGEEGEARPPRDLQDQCLRVALHAFVSQMKLGLESATAINAAALDLLEDRVLAATRSPDREGAEAGDR